VVLLLLPCFYYDAVVIATQLVVPLFTYKRVEVLDPFVLIQSEPLTAVNVGTSDVT